MQVRPKEEEYLKFTKYIYNLQNTVEKHMEFWELLVYSLEFTAQLFEFEFLDRVYTSPDLKELSQLPSRLFNAIKNFSQGNGGVYCRFYSIAMECQDSQAYYPTLNYITVEKIKDFNIKATGVDKKLPFLNKKWIQREGH